MEIKAWIVWNYISSADGHILYSFVDEFQGSSDELQKETEKRNDESKKEVTAVVHRVIVLAILSP